MSPISYLVFGSGVTRSVWSRPSRRTTISSSRPAAGSSSMSSFSHVGTGRPFTLTKRSPGRMPTVAAGDGEVTRATSGAFFRYAGSGAP